METDQLFVEFTGQLLGALMFSLICFWINDWVINREVGDLRRRRGHNDVNVMDEFEANSLTDQYYQVKTTPYETRQ